MNNKSKSKNVNWNEIALLVACIGVLLLSPFIVKSVVLQITNALETDSTNWVAIIEAFGTIFLGIIAVYQNRNARKTNERLTEIESNRDEMALRPSVLLTNWRGLYKTGNAITFNPEYLYIDIGNGTVQNGHFGDEYPVLLLEFTNTTTSFLILEYWDATVFSNLASAEQTKINSWSNGIVNRQNSRLVIPPGEAREIGFYAPQPFFDSIISNLTKLELRLDNQIGQKYLEVIDFTLIEFKQLNPKDDFIFATIWPGIHHVEKFNKKVIE